MFRAFITWPFSSVDFWELTPKLFLIYRDAANDIKEDEYKQAVTIAWVGAKVSKSEKDIRLQDLLPELREQYRIDNPDLFAAAISDLSASLPQKTWEEIMSENQD